MPGAVGANPRVDSVKKGVSKVNNNQTFYTLNKGVTKMYKKLPGKKSKLVFDSSKTSTAQTEPTAPTAPKQTEGKTEGDSSKTSTAQTEPTAPTAPKQTEGKTEGDSSKTSTAQTEPTAPTAPTAPKQTEGKTDMIETTPGVMPGAVGANPRVDSVKKGVSKVNNNQTFYTLNKGVTKMYKKLPGKKSKLVFDSSKTSTAQTEPTAKTTKTTAPKQTEGETEGKTAGETKGETCAKKSFCKKNTRNLESFSVNWSPQISTQLKSWER